MLRESVFKKSKKIRFTFTKKTRTENVNYELAFCYHSLQRMELIRFLSELSESENLAAM
jgi:hypothetical protein